MEKIHRRDIIVLHVVLTLMPIFMALPIIGHLFVTTYVILALNTFVQVFFCLKRLELIKELYNLSDEMAFLRGKIAGMEECKKIVDESLCPVQP